ncbi:MAG: hypothetical protein NTW19_01510 [Planctomycetota bacterium]|nr:hypothetical protein [Planctomycetota bacterium]
MNGMQLKRLLCSGDGPILLPIAEVKSRLGEPQDIRLSRKWCRQTGRDLVILTYALDNGEAQVLGFMGFLGGEQALLDGWVVVEEKFPETAIAPSPASAGLQVPGLFDAPIAPIEADSDTPKDGPGGAAGDQFKLGDW